MSLRPAYRACCDAPGCRRSEMVPHERSGPARSQLVALGWTLLKHRIVHPGIVRRGFRPTRRVRQKDVGGGPRLIVLCPGHGAWRPKGGYYWELAK